MKRYFWPLLGGAIGALSVGKILALMASTDALAASGGVIPYSK